MPAPEYAQRTSQSSPESNQGWQYSVESDQTAHLNNHVTVNVIIYVLYFKINIIFNIFIDW